MMRFCLVAVALIALVGSVFAHSGVKNAKVKARMDSMTVIGAEMKILGQMAKGARPFDDAAARAAAAAIANQAAMTPVLFETPDDDPKSEAKVEIWSNFSDFSSKSENLEALARTLSASIEKPSDLGPAIKALGEACKACHETYRE